MLTIEEMYEEAMRRSGLRMPELPSAFDFLYGRGPPMRSNTLSSFLIAGGALRDSVFDKPIKDVDLFISYPSKLAHTEPLTLAYNHTLGYWALYGTSAIPVIASSISYPINLRRQGEDGSGDTSDSDWGSYLALDVPGLNVVVINAGSALSPEQFAEILFKRFPDSISKMACTVEPDPTIFIDPECARLCELRTIKWVGKSIPDRESRLRLKYPDWSWVRDSFAPVEKAAFDWKDMAAKYSLESMFHE